MGKGIFIGDSSNISRKMKAGFIGDSNGKARKIKNIYLGVNGVAKLVWQSMIEKITRFISCNYKNSISAYVNDTTLNMIFYSYIAPIKLNDNQYIAFGGDNGDSHSCSKTYAVVTFDDNNNITSFVGRDMSGGEVHGKCQMGSLYAYSTTGFYPYAICFRDLSSIYDCKRITTSGLCNDLYALDGNTIIGCYNNYKTVQLASYNYSADTETLSPALVNENVYGERLFHVSGNQYLLYYINDDTNYAYITPMIINNISSYSMGNRICLGTGFSRSIYGAVSMDDNHLVIYDLFGHVYGVYVNNNVASISNIISGTFYGLCRIGNTSSLFGMCSDTVTGNIIYYDLSNNTLSILATNITPTSSSLGNKYPYYSNMSLFSRGEKKIVAVYGSTSGYEVSAFELNFEE